MFLSCVRSYFSFMRGCSSPDLLCARAKALGYDSVALTDYNSLVGLWSFLRACDTYGLRPVIGAEISDGGGQESVFMLARDDGGYRNLCKVISARKKDRFFDLTSLAQMEGKGLVILSSSLVLLEAFKKSSAKLVVNLGNRPTEQGRTLRNWALENQLPAVMTSSAVMATAEEQDLYALLRAIGSNDRFVRNGRKKDHACWIESWQSYKERFAVWPEVLPATESLAGICLFNGPDFGLVMPPWDSATYSAKTFLRKKAYAGARIRYGDDLSEAVVERLEHELGIIDTMGFSSYFLVVHTIVEEHFKKRLKSVPRICGRGSGAASLVAYCLEITNVCPLKHNLYFERFLNPGRSDAPDIDIDFAWDERDLILERVLHGYAGHAAMVATIIRFQPRMALRETAKAFGIPAGEIASYSRMLRKKDISSSVLQSPWPEILHLAGQLVTIPRHLSVHPGGVVITPQPLDCYVPVELAAKGVPVIQWDKDDAEEAGLVKIDLLGNRSLGVIRDCINAIPSRKKNFDEQYWQPEDDPATKRAVATGKTMGCFYIESPAMRLL